MPKIWIEIHYSFRALVNLFSSQTLSEIHPSKTKGFIGFTTLAPVALDQSIYISSRDLYIAADHIKCMRSLALGFCGKIHDILCLFLTISVVISFRVLLWCFWLLLSCFSYNEVIICLFCESEMPLIYTWTAGCLTYCIHISIVGTFWIMELKIKQGTTPCLIFNSFLEFDLLSSFALVYILISKFNKQRSIKYYECVW